jgi:hypothetical protein
LLYQSATVTASLSRLILLALVAGCARPASTPAAAASQPTAGSAAEPRASGPEIQGTMRGVLAPFASEALVLLPLQGLRFSVPEWTSHVGDERAYLTTVDDEIAFAIRERAFKGKWAFPADLARSARRNPGFAADPYAISVGPLAPVERDPDKFIAEPLAGQLRAFAGLFNARYAFVPVEMRVAPDASGGGRATLHAVVVDTRAAKITWKGDVTGDVVRAFSPAIAAGLAGRVADLFTPAR